MKQATQQCSRACRRRLAGTGSSAPTALCALVSALIFPTTGRASDVVAPRSDAAFEQDVQRESLAFVRSRAIDGVTGFDTASRTYTSRDGSTLEITLVGVVHIGDAAYYEEIVAELARHDVVLYESVLPRGAFGARGDTDLARQRATQDAMLFVRTLVARFNQETQRFPSDVTELRERIVARDTRLARPLDLALIDAWGRPISYTRTAEGFELRSQGSDGALGGQGTELDLVLGPMPEPDQFQADSHETTESVEQADLARKSGSATSETPKSESRDLYKELADALGVTLQVRSINYDRVGWEPADLPMEELLDRLWKRGERSFTLEMLSNDSGLQQGVVRFLLSLVSNSPSFKKMVVRALGQAGTRTQDGVGGEGALGDVDQRIILDERNDAVLDHLRLILQGPHRPSRIAIFYGAAHMPDFDRSLVGEFNMEAGPARWSTAMSVDEWSDAQIRERLEKFDNARTAILANDPQGAYPEAARIEWRIAALNARLEKRSKGTLGTSKPAETTNSRASASSQ